MAFHIVFNNEGENKIDMFFDKIEFSMYVDGILMRHSEIDIDEQKSLKGTFFDPRFEFARDGDETYTGSSVEVPPHSSKAGWIGFYVPADAKRFELRVGKETIIIDNPYN